MITKEEIVLNIQSLERTEDQLDVVYNNLNYELLDSSDYQAIEEFKTNVGKELDNQYSMLARTIRSEKRHGVSTEDDLPF